MTTSRFPGGPADSPGFLLWRATMRWQRLMTTALAPLDLTHVQFVVLACTWWLGRAGQEPSQAQLAAQAGIEPKMTSDVVCRLERKGFLERLTSPRDARANVVRLTAHGSAKTHAAIAAVEQVDAAHFPPSASSKDLLAVLRDLAGMPDEGTTRKGAEAHDDLSV